MHYRISDAPSQNENYFISDIVVDIYPDSLNFPDSSNGIIIDLKKFNMIKVNLNFQADSYLSSRIVNATMFPVGVNSSFRCNAQEFLVLKTDENEHAFISVSNLQLEAFRSQTNEKFNSGNKFLALFTACT